MNYSTIKVGSLVLIKNNPCKIIELNFSKPGKHGSGKKTVIGIDVITDKKYTDIYRDASIIQTFLQKKEEIIIQDIDSDGYIVYMNATSTNDHEKDINQGPVKMNNHENVDKVIDLFEEGNTVLCCLLTVEFGDKKMFRITLCKTMD